MKGENRVEARSGRALVGMAAGLLLALAAAAGCGRNQGSVPPGFAPDGRLGADNVLLVELDSIAVDTVTSTPAVRVRIFDATNADGYRVYRHLVDEQAFDEVVDYVGAFKGSFNLGYELYQVLDRDWRSDRFAEYLGRATVLGSESRRSPLTNVGTMPAGSFPALTPRDFQMVAPIDTAETDSLPLMQWQGVPGANRYLLRVERSDRRLFFWGLTPADGSTSYRVGSREGLRFQDKPLTPSTFFWTVEAVDAQHRVVGRTRARQIFQVKSSVPTP